MIMDELVKNKIEGHGRPLKEVMANKYVIDYFQREYKWEKKHIEQLLYDLNYVFLECYHVGDTIDTVLNSYKSYFMGPYIVCEDKSAKSLIDGQQRLTSLTLLFIYIMNLNSETKDTLMEFVCKKLYGRTSFNLQVKDRYPVMEYLLNKRGYDELDLDATGQNLLDRYFDIEDLFPENLKNPEILNLFVCWLCEKVTFVEILAYSDENAYSIFETMNDRGCNLTSVEMLKSFLLSKLQNERQRLECNEVWKRSIGTLVSYDKDADSEFMRAWLRGRYISYSKESNDFDVIGTTFHRWVKSNVKKMGLKTSKDIYTLICIEMPFYTEVFNKIKMAEKNMQDDFYEMNAQSTYGLAPSLTYPLYFAAVNITDAKEEIDSKIKLLAKTTDSFVARRLLDGKTIAQASIRGFLQDFISKVRGCSYQELCLIAKSFIDRYANNIMPVRADTVYTNKLVRYLHYRVNLYLNRLQDKEYLLTYNDCRSYRLYGLDGSYPVIEKGNNIKPVYDICLGDQKNLNSNLYKKIIYGVNVDYLELPSELRKLLNKKGVTKYEVFNWLLNDIWKL